VLSNSKAHCPQIQKLIYVVLISKRKLRHYFDAHPIMVVSKYPLKKSDIEPRGGREDREVGN
jgi:hypothetical protein